MYIVIEHAGKTYRSASTDEANANEVAEQMYKNMGTTKESIKLKLALDDGGYMVIGRKVLQSSVIILYDD